MTTPCVASSFSTRFAKTARQYSPFCCGIDPSLSLLQDWGLPATANGLGEFCARTLEAVCGICGIIKPQIAFFEAFGVAGIEHYHKLIKAAQKNGLLVIADIKRGDIGATMQAYGEAWLGAGSAFGADAVTASAWLGFDALSPLLRRAALTRSMVFIVVRSSNPQGAIYQSARIDDISLAQYLTQEIALYNQKTIADPTLNWPQGAPGPVGAVIGATIADQASQMIKALPNGLFLAPGIGAQGGEISALRHDFAGALARTIPAASRAILCAGPEIASLKKTLQRYCDAAQQIYLSGERS